jgi:hypothetical protein
MRKHTYKPERARESQRESMWKHMYKAELVEALPAT